jgi:radical SAM superfamily enzyme YgiQ (UPF0313 family)
VWRTDGQKPRQRTVDAVLEEIVRLRRLGFRFVALADDNFYPVTLADIELARRQNNHDRLRQLETLRAERFELMERMAQLPRDMCFFTQITMEAAEDPAFLDAMRLARIYGALVGVESVTPEGLKDVYKEFNLAGNDLIERLRTFRRHGVSVLGSFIFGLPSDRPETFEATAAAAEQAELSLAQFVMLIPYPGTVDFARWEEKIGNLTQIAVSRSLGAGSFRSLCAPSFFGRTQSCPPRKFAPALRTSGIISTASSAFGNAQHLFRR